MPEPHHSADLILKLYDLRREARMREARQWVIGFTPDSADDLVAVMRGPDSASFRMVATYWDMAASLVLNGAIDEQMFTDANAEHVAVFALWALGAYCVGYAFFVNSQRRFADEV